MTGAAWLSSARALRCSVRSVNERNPCLVLYISQETALVNREEGEDDVKSAWPLCLGLLTCYNGVYNGQQNRKVKPIPSKHLQVRIEGCNSTS